MQYHKISISLQVTQSDGVANQGTTCAPTLFILLLRPSPLILTAKLIKINN